LQNKKNEIEFFDRFSQAAAYDVLTPAAYRRIIREFQELLRPLQRPGLRIIDLGCGSGAFTRRFQQMFPACFFGMDISERSIAAAAAASPDIGYTVGDIEHSGFADHSFDVALFSGVLHHFPDFQACLREAYRILKKGGCVLSYDPNIRNPAMWIYRHPRSPFSSRQGRTANERLLAAEDIRGGMEKSGFHHVRVRGRSGITFKYVASPVGRSLLPLYNLLEVLFAFTPLAGRFGSFLIGYGEK